MKIHVLGSEAGGGYPQWNCNCSNCYGIRNGTIRATPRTQSSIAVSSDNENWILFNASPDLGAQLVKFPEIQPSRGLRDSGIKAVVLVDAHIDHVAGLLSLREGCPIDVYATPEVHEDLNGGLPIFTALESCNGGFNWCPIDLQPEAFQMEGFPDLHFTAVPLPGRAPTYSDHHNDSRAGDNIGIFIEDGVHQTSLFYAPGLVRITPDFRRYCELADCLLVDGSFWSDDEMIQAGVGTEMATEMGHLPQSGEQGMIEFLRQVPNARKVLIHINNTNPILVENSSERHLLRNEGIEVAYDGMQIRLQAPASRPESLLKVLP